MSSGDVGDIARADFVYDGKESVREALRGVITRATLHDVAWEAAEFNLQRPTWWEVALFEPYIQFSRERQGQ